MEKNMGRKSSNRRSGSSFKLVYPSSPPQHLPKLRSLPEGVPQGFSPNPRVSSVQKPSAVVRYFNRLKRIVKRLAIRHPILVSILYTTVIFGTFYELAVQKPQEHLSSYQQFLVQKICSINKNVPKDQALNWVKLIQTELDGYPWLAQYGYDLPMCLGHIMTESEFNVACTSSAWAVGLMQLQYRTAEDGEDALDIVLGDKHHRLYDPHINIKFGINHMSYLIAKYRNLDRALSSYWAGIAGSKHLTNPLSNEYTRNVRKNRLLFVDKS